MRDYSIDRKQLGLDRLQKMQSKQDENEIIIDPCNLKTMYKITPLRELNLSQDVDIKLNLNQSMGPSIELKELNDKNSSSFNVTLINTFKSIVGSGILSLPWGFSKAAILPSIIAVVMVGIFSCSTAIFVIHACEITQSFCFCALLNVISPIWEKIGFFVLLYCIFSSCLGYSIVVADSISDGMYKQPILLSPYTVIQILL